MFCNRVLEICTVVLLNKAEHVLSMSQKVSMLRAVSTTRYCDDDDDDAVLYSSITPCNCSMLGALGRVESFEFEANGRYL